MKIIGITGGIGSGKSYVASVTAKYFPVLHVSTDDIAKEQMKKGGISYDMVVKTFGDICPQLLDEDGEINRAALSKTVFSDNSLLDMLNSITHPNVISELKSIIEREEKKGFYSAVLIETALIFESGIDKMCDSVWDVYASLNCRKRRLKASRGYSEEKIVSILDDQLDEEEFKKKSDIVIVNDDSTDIRDLIISIDKALKSL